MSAYWINTFTSITDENRLQQYAALAGPAMVAAGGKFLARGRPDHALEAATLLRVTLIEFPDTKASLDAYHSPAYQNALRILGDTATREIRIIDGYLDANPPHQV